MQIVRSETITESLYIKVTFCFLFQVALRMDLFPVYQKELVSSDLTREWKRKGQLLSSMELSQRYISTKLFIFISLKFAHCITSQSSCYSKGATEPITVKFANNPSNNAKAIPPLAAYLAPQAARRALGAALHPASRFR